MPRNFKNQSSTYALYNNLSSPLYGTQFSQEEKNYKKNEEINEKGITAFVSLAWC